MAPCAVGRGARHGLGGAVSGASHFASTFRDHFEQTEPAWKPSTAGLLPWIGVGDGALSLRSNLW